MFCDYIAGLVSGVASLIIGHPFDTIKIQQQIRSISFMEAARRVRQHRGWGGYYRGLLLPLLTTGTLNAIFFGLYGDIRDFLVEIRTTSKSSWNLAKETHHQNSIWDDITTKDVRNEKEKSSSATFSELFIAGSAAGVATLFLNTPMELIKTKLQSQMKRKMFKGPKDCILAIYREKGIRGMYRGSVPLGVRDGLPGGGVYFVVYEAICKKFDANAKDNHKRMLVQTCAGGLAGWMTCLPFDVVKSRMQADDHIKPHYRGMVHCAREIHRCEGLIGLFRGAWSCAARAIPVNALIFFVYEYYESKVCKDQ